MEYPLDESALLRSAECAQKKRLFAISLGTYLKRHNGGAAGKTADARDGPRFMESAEKADSKRR
jgi:hypothetical protein